MIDAVIASSYLTGQGYANTFQWPAPVTKAAVWFKGIQFLADGKLLQLTSIRRLDALLRQKYMATIVDLGGNVLSLIDASLPNIDEGSQTVRTPLTTVFKVEIEWREFSQVYFLWQDEAGVPHVTGSITNPHHNLGYIESTVTPDSMQPFGGTFTRVYLSPPDLRLQSGDYIQVASNGLLLTDYYTVIEMFDIEKTPSWYAS